MKMPLILLYFQCMEIFRSVASFSETDGVEKTQRISVTEILLEYSIFAVITYLDIKYSVIGQTKKYNLKCLCSTQ